MFLQKLKDVIGSSNARINMLAILLSAAFALDPTITFDPRAVAEGVLKALSIGDVLTIVAILTSQVIQPLSKVIKKGVEWRLILKSSNFWTNVVTFVLVSLEIILGVVFPDSAATEIVGSIFTGQFDLIALAFGTQVVNFVYHLFIDKTPIGTKISKWLDILVQVISKPKVA